MRATLKVRFMINGNGFHHGRALVSYRPHHQYDTTQKWRYGLVPQDIIAASQKMHLWLDPTKSQGGTITLPFVFWNDYMSIPKHEWDKMGELDIASITTLQHANGGTDSVTISIFAWAEEVQMSIPTGALPDTLLPQAGVWEMQADEYENEDGPISKPANIVAEAAGKLSAIPTLKPMAMATQMAAGAVATTARAFGFSRPVDVSTPSKYIPKYSSSLAVANAGDTSEKLTFDLKQEVTVSNSACGIGSDDEMTINSIAGRESYLTQFSWSTSDVPETVLWNCRVNPNLYDRFGDEIHYTPMGYVARPFDQWRGTIKFRFQIVASAYHKGRLKIVYDPYFYNHAIPDYNVAYTHIIDLARERDFTIEVGWGQPQSYADHPVDSFGVPFSTAQFVSTYDGIDNGTIGIAVVNDLTTPSATLSDISVLVSVSAGDDFELVNPSGTNIENLSFYAPQSGEWETQSGNMEQADADFTTEESKPMSENTETKLSCSVSKTNDANAIYYGDPVTSLRQILKRYCYSRTWTSLEFGTAEEYVTYLKTSNFPLNRGYALDAVDYCTLPVDPTPYTYARMIPLNYFAPLFCCMRGGTRVKYVFEAHRGDGRYLNAMMSVSRRADNGSSLGNQLLSIPTAITNTDSPSQSAYMSMQGTLLNSFDGAAFTPVQVNPVLEVELPYHSNIRFTLPRNMDIALQAGENNRQHSVIWPTTGNGKSSVAQLWSTAEDFNLCFFQSCPIVYLQGDPPPSPTN